MTEQQLRQKVVKIANSWVGRKEGSSGHKEILDIYNSHLPRARGYKMQMKDPWCAATVSAIFIKAGLADIGFPECSCSKMIELYKAKGRWKEADNYVPSLADLIMYDWQDSGKGDNTGAPDHVGMVVEVSGSTIKVVEGNFDGSPDSVGVRTLKVNGRYIRGYCLPDYASKVVGSPVSDPTPQPSASTTHAQKPATAPKADPARSFERDFAKTYTVTASTLNMRTGASTNKKIIKKLPLGSKVTCYGYYTKSVNTIWLLVKDSTGTVGFCSKKYLK